MCYIVIRHDVYMNLKLEAFFFVENVCDVVAYLCRYVLMLINVSINENGI